MFAAPLPVVTQQINILDLLPTEHRAEAEQFFRELKVAADIRGVTVAEALADALRPHLRVLRRAMGIEAYEESALTITDLRGNALSFALSEPEARHLSQS